MANATVGVIIKEECFLDEILNELPNRLSKPPPTVKTNNLSIPKLFHQISDSLKDIQLIYTCLDVSSLILALGTNVGNAFMYQRNHKKILKISCETKYVPTTCIKLAAGCGMVAFAHETGTFAVALVDPPIHREFDSLTTQDIHHSSVTCLEWSTDGLILYAGDSDGKISLSVVKISEGILQTAIIVEENASIVQLSYTSDSLLASTIKRTIIWSFRTEKISQVGEKERKTTGCFGCCFIPDNLQEPSKQLYAARPGQRIWTADESGKVSSTSVFKTLLANKPQTIYTLTGNDSKMNSGGQFGRLIMYYNKFVVTWDQNHLWVLDLHEGAVVSCHSNVGKIRNVAVSGHELFVLLNQKESFIRRFTIVSEDLGPTCLDAVIAIHGDVVKSSSKVAAKFEQSKETGNDSVVPATKPTTEETKLIFSHQENKVDLPMSDDVFQRINSIPIDCGKGDIVFTGVKKKKKKKVKQESKVEASFEEDAPENVTPEVGNRGESPLLGSVASEDEMENKIELPSLGKLGLECSKQEANVSKIQDDGSPVLPEVSEGKLNTVVPHEVSASNQELLQASTNEGKLNTVVPHEVFASNQEVLQDMALTNEGNQTAHDLNEVPRVTNGDDAIECSSDQQADTSYSQKEVNDVVVIDHKEKVTMEATARQEMGEERDVDKRDDAELVSHTSVNDDSAPDAMNDSVVSPGLESPVPTSPLYESLSSGDEFQMFEKSSNYLRSDSYESETPGDVGASTESEEEKHDEKFHAPLFADTWSSRALPTAYAIENLAISENYVFCVDGRGVVYYSDPNSASCHGWEQVNWKATQMCVDGSCDLIGYVGKDDKAYVRANVGTQYPVGNKSFQIMEDVSVLATCSVCTWAISTNGGLRRADTSMLSELKGDVKHTKIWRQEELPMSFDQIACYNDVVWGRTVDESLHVYAGRSGGKKASWKNVEEMKAKWISMSDDGTLWIIAPDDHIWFNPGVSTSSPTGEVWYQVTLGDYIIDDPSIVGSAVNFFHSMGSAYRSARTTEYLRHAAKGFIQSTKDMAFSLFRDGGSPKQIYCNMKGGVWLVDTKNALHACRGQVTGAYWKLVCPTGTAQSVTWCRVSSGFGNYVWALQPNGELTCFDPKGPSYNVTAPSCAASLDFITSSPHGVWCFASGNPARIYIREGIADGYPQGFAWFSLKLHDQAIKSLNHLSVGGITVWAVDYQGKVWIRIGSVGGDQSNVLSQAWLALDNPPHAELIAVEVNAKDSMVWAIDTKGNVYARYGIEENYLVGHGWREVSGAMLESVCLSSCVVYGLCTNGEIVCRFGVSPKNCIGDYWKKIPGDFAQISVNNFGELWGISHEGRLFVRKTKCLFGKMAANEVKEKENDSKEKETHFVDEVDGDEFDWELL